MKKIIAANWKTYKTWEQAQTSAQELIDLLPQDIFTDREVLVFPSPALLKIVAETVRTSKITCGAQNFYPVEEGAITGETGTAQLRDIGCTHILIGHSERRHILHEPDELIAQKVHFALQAGLIPVLCIGETLTERKQGQVETVLSRQLESALTQDKNAKNIVIAYEPVWAIGTGEVAGSEEIMAAHRVIRQWLKKNTPAGEAIPVLYGGSVKPKNCSQILSLDNVNGVLVGGASLESKIFSQIVLA